MLTILIPAYNEQATIGVLLRRVAEAPYDKQIIVVDDASTDATADILAGWDCQVIRHPANRGKGAAIRTGLAHAVGEFTIVQDADLEYDPRDYPKLIEPLLLGADVVYGSRYLRREVGSAVRTGTAGTSDDSAGIKQGLVRTADPTRAIGSVTGDKDPAPSPRPSPLRGAREMARPAVANRLGVAVLNLAVQLLYGARLTDEATCYKAFPTATLRAMDLQCERFEFCPEATAKALRMGLKITEVPISYSARSTAEGKKIRWRDGLEALQTLWRWRNWRPSYSPRPPSGPSFSGRCQSSSKLAAR